MLLAVRNPAFRIYAQIEQTLLHSVFTFRSQGSPIACRVIVFSKIDLNRNTSTYVTFTIFLSLNGNRSGRKEENIYTHTHTTL